MSSEVHERHGFRIGENTRGILVMVFGSLALVGLAYGAMVVLTSPDSWITKAAVSGATGEEAAQVASFGSDDAQ
jgi:hypothetical protein